MVAAGVAVPNAEELTPPNVPDAAFPAPVAAEKHGCVEGPAGQVAEIVVHVRVGVPGEVAAGIVQGVAALDHEPAQ